MAVRLITKEDILKALEGLSADSLAEVWRFAEFLQYKAGAVQPRQIIQLGGLWKGYPPITETDITEARREMWGNFADRHI